MIRIVELPSAELLSQMHCACFAPGWGEAACASVLNMPGAHCWIASDDEEPLGFLVMTVVAGEAEIITTGTLPGARRRGVARSLLSEAFSTLRDTAPVFLEVSERNTAAIALYRELGFEESGRRRGYYADGADAILMTRPGRVPCG